MADRRAQIVALLDIRYEALPGLAVRSSASSGFSHRVRVAVSCPDCLANDRIMFGCETCGGRGVVEAWQSRDPYATDHVAPYGFDPTRHERERARDREIEVLGDQTAAPASEADLLAVANANPYAWERARARLYEVYDLAALDRALEELRGRFPGLSPYSRSGLLFLSVRLPRPLRAPRPGDVASRVAQLVGRDVAIRRAARSGQRVEKIAAEFGLSVSRVYEIVNGGGS